MGSMKFRELFGEGLWLQLIDSGLHCSSKKEARVGDFSEINGRLRFFLIVWGLCMLD